MNGEEDAAAPHNQREVLEPASSDAASPSMDATAFQSITGQAAAAHTSLDVASVPGYEVMRELGRGGMGIVYLARDKRRDKNVALKTLPSLDPSALYRFKQEFRSLADVSHPNLIVLYDLLSTGQQWCFTMEFVQGEDFLVHVRQHEPAGRPPRDLDRLRSGFRQLAEGVSALHLARRLHRDLKPSNVMVTPEGRVVLMDFGLAAELDLSGKSVNSDRMGTITYMAPEQAGALSLTPACDWYSLGVMLYEALTGRPPFVGPARRVLSEKQGTDPAAPRELVPQLPDDLNDLCLEMIRRDPAARPDAVAILERLGVCTVASAAMPRYNANPEVALVGREHYLEGLADAFAASRRGCPVAVYVHGHSGVGKSALVQAFLDKLAAANDTVVLSGRCYERESVPYRAFDSLVDALSRHLQTLTPADVEALLPREVHSLARVFPVLRQVQAVARAPSRDADIPDPQELRRRAFAALRELLARLGKRSPLVLAIDDLQWGDADSAALLAELLRPPDPPALLFIGSYRTEEMKASPFVRTVQESVVKEVAGLDRRELEVVPLTEAQARDLALRLLSGQGTANLAQADGIARESGGNPFFVYQLTQSVQAGAGTAPQGTRASPIALDQVLWERVQRLPDRARLLLEIVAVAGRPLLQEDACQAAQFDEDERSVIAELRSGRLLRRTGLEQESVETYHDRVRESVLAHLSPATLQKHHQSLAQALEKSAHGDAETLAIHFHGARHLDRAAALYSQAADEAAAALAFDHASQLYRLALELNPPLAAVERGLRTKLGDALANAGRGAEAAQEYLAASDGAEPEENLELRRRAVMQLLISGFIDEGLEVLTKLLKCVGIRLPASRFWTVVHLLARRLFNRILGIEYRERVGSSISSAESIRLDICASAAQGLLNVDYLLGAYFQSRSMRLALDLGEPTRVVRALALEAAHLSTAGTLRSSFVDRLFERAQAIADRLGDPASAGYTALANGFAFHLRGDWRKSFAMSTLAEKIFREKCVGMNWEMDSANTFALWSLSYLGRLGELSQRYQILLRQAKERRDRYAITNLSTYIMTAAKLREDSAQLAQEELHEISAEWSSRGFHVQHHNIVIAQTWIHLYQGQGQKAFDFINQNWAGYQTSLLMKIQQVRIDITQCRARSAIAASYSHADPESLLRRAARDARSLEKERCPWAAALASLVHACLAARRGQWDRAIVQWQEAVAKLEAVDMALFAAAAKCCLGQILRGQQGNSLIGEAEEWMRGQEIKEPSRMIAALAPGTSE